MLLYIQAQVLIGLSVGVLALLLALVALVACWHMRGAPMFAGLLAWGCFAMHWDPVGWAFAILGALLMVLGVFVVCMAMANGHL
jgi:hypothetical protein